MCVPKVKCSCREVSFFRRFLPFNGPWYRDGIKMHLRRITFMQMKSNQESIGLVMVVMLMLGASMGCKREIQSPKPEIKDDLPIPHQILIDYDTIRWTEIKDEDGFVIDVKYATADNFVKEVIYPCGRMFLRPEVAKALYKIRDELLPEGYRLKLFDGYRPRPAQQKLWDKVPNRNYVAPPSEGSMHNRGVAIDLTLADKNGKEIDMGTPYDFFGPEAHHDFTQFAPDILKHRQKLKTIMESHGFQAIRTEWWHYSFSKGAYPLDDWQWPCLD